MCCFIRSATLIDTFFCMTRCMLVGSSVREPCVCSVVCVPLTSMNRAFVQVAFSVASVPPSSFLDEREHITAALLRSAMPFAQVSPQPGTAPEEEAKKPGEDEESIPYNFFNFNTPTVNSPSELHQASIHFAMHPSVPMHWKLYYVSLSMGALALQSIALLGLMSDIENMDTSDILSNYQSMRYLDWYMSILVGLLAAFSVQNELTQARLAEVMIKHAMASDDEAVAIVAMRWSIPLLLIQRVRSQILVPLTVVTAPILAIENGLDALNVALNVRHAKSLHAFATVSPCFHPQPIYSGVSTCKVLVKFMCLPHQLSHAGHGNPVHL